MHNSSYLFSKVCILSLSNVKNVILCEIGKKCDFSYLFIYLSYIRLVRKKKQMMIDWILFQSTSQNLDILNTTQHGIYKSKRFLSQQQHYSCQSHVTILSAQNLESGHKGPLIV